MRASTDSGSPENVAFNAGNSIKVRATAWSRKSLTDNFGAAGGRLAANSPRMACNSVQSTELVTVNCGMVALLKLMARARARRIGERGIGERDCATVSAGRDAS